MTRRKRAEKVFLVVDMTVGDMVDAVSDWGYESTIDLIQQLDQNKGDWDFTKKVAAYFAKEMKKYEAEEKTELANALAAIKEKA